MNPISTKDQILFRPRGPNATEAPALHTVYSGNAPSHGYVHAEIRAPTSISTPTHEPANDTDQEKGADQDKDALSIARGAQAQVSRYSEFKRSQAHRLEPTN